MPGKVKRVIGLAIPVALLVITAGYFWQAGYLSRAGTPEKITIGTNLNEMLGLLFIAGNRGYYRAQGLEVVIKEYQSGLGPLKEVGEGRLDLASCAEFALVGEIFAGRGDQLRCLAVIGSGEIDLLIAAGIKALTGRKI